ncbi:MAG: S8 family serine peptidase [Candidatus Aenigmarchaeota archaeon]|nr:S8 family serine peptidase [Candidatus Aenigmarchaeota archaeon]
MEADVQIGADKVWAEGINGSGVKVCMIDTGVDYNHPALEGKINSTNPAECYHSLDNGTDVGLGCMDENTHETWTAGIVASQDATYKGVAYGTYSIKSNSKVAFEATPQQRGFYIFIIDASGKDSAYNEISYSDELRVAVMG